MTNQFYLSTLAGQLILAYFQTNLYNYSGDRRGLGRKILSECGGKCKSKIVSLSRVNGNSAGK